MHRLLKMVVWLIGIVAALALLVVVSIPVDAALGRGRLDTLVNTSIPNPNGPDVRAFVARPTTPGPHPAVIMVHEWWGLKPEIVGKAAALANEGYVVVAPDTFRGNTTSWIPRAIYQVSTTLVERVNADLDAVLAWLQSQPDVTADAIAIIGFCYGGRTALFYSLHNPDDVAATITLYGMGPTDPAELRTLQSPVLGIFGGADQSIPLDEVRALEAGLNQANVPNTISVYEGQPHAFVGSIEEIRLGGAPQQAWNEVLAFLQQTLKDRHAVRSDTRVTHRAVPLGSIVGRLHHVVVCGLQS